MFCRYSFDDGLCSSALAYNLSTGIHFLQALPQPYTITATYKDLVHIFSHLRYERFPRIPFKRFRRILKTFYPLSVVTLKCQPAPHIHLRMLFLYILIFSPTAILLFYDGPYFNNVLSQYVSFPPVVHSMCYSLHPKHGHKFN